MGHLKNNVTHRTVSHWSAPDDPVYAFPVGAQVGKSIIDTTKGTLWYRTVKDVYQFNIDGRYRDVSYYSPVSEMNDVGIILGCTPDRNKPSSGIGWLDAQLLALALVLKVSTVDL